MRQHTMNTHTKKPRINRQKVTFPGSAYPKEISQQCTLPTQKHCTTAVSMFQQCMTDLLKDQTRVHRQTAVPERVLDHGQLTRSQISSAVS